MKDYEWQIQVLPMDKLCFVKQIYLEDNHFSGVVCYTRSLTNEYKMGERNSEGHDPQGYPYDILDEAILYALQRVYSNAFCKTSLQVCNVELDYNNLWKGQREVYPIDIYIEEMVEELLPNYSFPIRHPRWVSILGVELYCIKGVAFDLNKALQYYLYQCGEEEYKQIYDLATKTYRPMSQNN